MEYIYFLIIYVMVTYGATNIIVYQDIFGNFREWLHTVSDFWYSVVSCPICCSTWIGFLASTILLITGNSTPSSLVAEFPVLVTIFLDGLFTSAAVTIITKNN